MSIDYKKIPRGSTYTTVGTYTRIYLKVKVVLIYTKLSKIVIVKNLTFLKNIIRFLNRFCFC